MKPNSNYKRMLDGMQRKEKRQRRKKKEPWFLYILECADQTLYTGITNNLERRFKAHSAGRASRFTRTRLPVKLRYQETCKSRTQALIREYAVKCYPRKKKLSLIHVNPSLRVLVTGFAGNKDKAI